MSAKQTARSEKLPLFTKIAYALGDFGPSAGPGTIIPFFFLFFLTDVVKLHPRLAGLSLLVGKIWDAINDPLVGMLSDHTRTRWGRRRPYLLLGAIPFGLTFFLLWVTPPWRDQTFLWIYFALLYIVFDTAFTAVGAPYKALIPELTLDYDERTSLTAYRMVVSIGGGLIGAVLPLTIVGFFPDKRVGFAAMGAIFGVLFVLPIFLSFAVAREREEFQAQAALPPLESLRYVVRNRPLWYVLGLEILSWLSVDILSAVFIYYLKYWIGIPEGDASVVLGLVLFSAMLFIPLFVKLSQRIEKKWAFVCGMSTWALIQLAIFLVPQGSVKLAYILAFLAGIGVSAAHVMPSSMRPDVLEVDELASGHRQEGIYAGLAVFIRKLATALALWGIGTALGWAGYVPEAATQPDSALRAIRIIMGPVPALLLIATIVIAYFYPLTREKHAEILGELARRGDR